MWCIKRTCMKEMWSKCITRSGVNLIMALGRSADVSGQPSSFLYKSGSLYFSVIFWLPETLQPLCPISEYQSMDWNLVGSGTIGNSCWRICQCQRSMSSRGPTSVWLVTGSRTGCASMHLADLSGHLSLLVLLIRSIIMDLGEDANMRSTGNGGTPPHAAAQ